MPDQSAQHYFQTSVQYLKQIYFIWTSLPEHISYIQKQYRYLQLLLY